MEVEISRNGIGRTSGFRKILLLKPETFMNLSGNSVAAAAGFYKLAPQDVVVFHDELDLPPGKCRAKQGGGHAGHNGLKSLHTQIGPDYARVRIGIGHPGHKDRVAAYVLHNFSKADQLWLDDVMRGISDGAPDLAANDNGRFMNAVAQRTVQQSSPITPHPAVKRRQASTISANAGSPPDMRSGIQKLIDRFRQA